MPSTSHDFSVAGAQGDVESLSPGRKGRPVNGAAEGSSPETSQVSMENDHLEWISWNEWLVNRASYFMVIEWWFDEV